MNLFYIYCLRVSRWWSGLTLLSKRIFTVGAEPSTNDMTCFFFSHVTPIVNILLGPLYCKPRILILNLKRFEKP